MLLLRGTDIHARTGGDIDILVPSRQAVRACLLLAWAARAKGWYLAFFRDIGYLAQVVLIRQDYKNEDVALKVDFFAGFEWYGVGSDIVSQRFFKFMEDAEPTASEEMHLSAAVNFFQKCLIVGRLGERDWARVVSSKVSATFLVELANVLGLPITARDIAVKGTTGWRQWRLRIASGGIRSPIGFILWFFRVAFAHFRLRLGLHTRAGHLFALSGLDGSGKSTQIERLFAVYRQAGDVQPRLVHLLPAWIPMPHQLLRRKKTEQNYTRPYSEPPVHSKWSGLMRLTYYLCAFIVAKYWLRIATLRGQMLVLDRSFVDFAADLTRSRIPDFHLPAWLCRFCTPRGSLLFLDALPETVGERKGELQPDKATELRQRYRNIFRQVGGQVINAEGSPEEVFTRILEQVDRIILSSTKTAAMKMDDVDGAGCA